VRKPLPARDKRADDDADHTHVIRIPLPPLETLMAACIVALAVGWRAWAVMRWTFQADDWTYVANASKLPFLEFVGRQYTGHLLPGQFALVWLVSRAAPLNYTVAVAPLLALALLSGLLMWRFLTALFGHGPANLIPLALFMLCPLTVPPTLWWTTALTIVPLQLFIVAVLFVVLLYVRRPSARRLAGAGALYAAAVIFWEKAVLILPLTVLFVLFYLGKGRGASRLRAVTVGAWRLWTVMSGITLVYVGWYAAVVRGAIAGRPSFLQLERLAGKSFGSTIIPTFLGGPWTASSLGRAFVHELSLPARVVTWVAVALIVVVSMVRLRPAWRAWALLAAYLGMCMALVAIGRLRLVGADSGLASRYYADSVPVFAIAVALAFMVPLDRRGRSGWVTRFVVLETGQGGAGSMLRHPRGQVRPWLGAEGASRTLIAGVIVAYAVSAGWTSFRIADTADSLSAKGWFANVRAGLEEHPTASIVDGHLPGKAAPPVLDQGKLSRALAPIAPTIRWNAPDEHPLIFDPTGTLVPVQVGSAATSEPGPLPGCGYRAGPSPVSIALRPALFFWSWGVRLAYSTDVGHQGSVMVDGDRRSVRFLRGSHALFLLHRGTATEVTIDGGDVPVCVERVRVGLVKPGPPPG
jgi:hypothetical protein